MSDSRRVTNWMSLRKQGNRCVVQMTVSSGEGSVSLHRALTPEQLNQLIGAARQIATKLEKTEEVRDVPRQYTRREAESSDGGRLARNRRHAE